METTKRHPWRVTTLPSWGGGGQITHPNLQNQKIRKATHATWPRSSETIIQSTCKSGNGQELNPELQLKAARCTRSGAELVTELIVAVPVRSPPFSRRQQLGRLLLRGTCRPGTLSSSACTPAQYSLRNIPTHHHHKSPPPLTRSLSVPDLYGT